MARKTPTTSIRTGLAHMLRPDPNSLLDAIDAAGEDREAAITERSDMQQDIEQAWYEEPEAWAASLNAGLVLAKREHGWELYGLRTGALLWSDDYNTGKAPTAQDIKEAATTEANEIGSQEE